MLCCVVVSNTFIFKLHIARARCVENVYSKYYLSTLLDVPSPKVEGKFYTKC